MVSFGPHRRDRCRRRSSELDLRERLIVYGALTEPDSGETVGVALALHAADKDTAVALLRDVAAELDAFPCLEVHDWELGGRR